MVRNVAAPPPLPLQPLPEGQNQLDRLLDNFFSASSKSKELAEAAAEAEAKAAEAEAKAAQAAEEAAAAYLAAAEAVGTLDFEGLRDTAEAAERLLESLTLAATRASQEYLDASHDSMHASSAAFEAAIHDEEQDAEYVPEDDGGGDQFVEEVPKEP